MVIENEFGWIEDIASTYVVVRVWDRRRLIVPLSYFMEKPFQNWTRESAAILGAVTLRTDYTVPVEELRKKAAEFAARSNRAARDGSRSMMAGTGSSPLLSRTMPPAFCTR